MPSSTTAGADSPLDERAAPATKTKIMEQQTLSPNTISPELTEAVKSALQQLKTELGSFTNVEDDWHGFHHDGEEYDLNLFRLEDDRTLRLNLHPTVAVEGSEFRSPEPNTILASWEGVQILELLGIVPIIDNGYLIDSETGEVLDVQIENAPEFHVHDKDSANWVLEKMSIEDAEILAIQARINALTENLEAQKKKHENRRKFLEMRFGSELEQFAREMLEAAGGKSKTLTLDFGKISFRTTQGTNKITDMEAAVEWCKRSDILRDLIKVQESVLVSELKATTEHFNSTLPAHNEVRIDFAGLSFIESTPPVEKMKIETGVK